MILWQLSIYKPIVNCQSLLGPDKRAEGYAIAIRYGQQCFAVAFTINIIQQKNPTLASYAESCLFSGYYYEASFLYYPLRRCYCGLSVLKSPVEAQRQ